MALQWKWDNQSGTVTLNGNTFSFYEGNALMIVLNEYKNDKGKDMYDLAWFFADKAHAKACLGLEKDTTDMFEGNIEQLTIYRNHCSKWKNLIDLFLMSQPNITITILQQKPEVAE